jgi:hypothetical protein
MRCITLIDCRLGRITSLNSLVIAPPSREKGIAAKAKKWEILLGLGGFK